MCHYDKTIRIIYKVKKMCTAVVLRIRRKLESKKQHTVISEKKTSLVTSRFNYAYQVDVTFCWCVIFKLSLFLRTVSTPLTPMKQICPMLWVGNSFSHQSIYMLNKILFFFPGIKCWYICYIHINTTFSAGRSVPGRPGGHLWLLHRGLSIAEWYLIPL